MSNKPDQVSGLRSQIYPKLSGLTPHPSDDEVLVRVENVSKKFCRSLKKSLWYGMKDLGSELIGRSHGGNRKLRPDEFWAVNDVSFELRRGECLGLIGRNGAGKTTLLRMLNGLIKPDRGRIEMRGRVGALISLGAGFNPILTGRENIYVNASVLGIKKKQIDEKFDKIIDFAEIEEFIDSPVLTYSSGMQVRLGFAIASALEPDVLLLDEVLAVGDAAFRAKCYNRIGRILQKSAVIFVSHSMSQIAQVSSSVLYMKRGQIGYFGDTKDGVAAYNSENSVKENENDKVLVIEAPVDSAHITIKPVKVKYSKTLTINYEIVLQEDMLNSTIRIPFYNTEGRVVSDWSSKGTGEKIDLKKGFNSGVIELGPIHLAPGQYSLGFVLNDSTGVLMPFWSLKQYKVEVFGGYVGSSQYNMPIANHKLTST